MNPSILDSAKILLTYYYVVDSDKSDPIYNDRVEAAKNLCLMRFENYTGSDDSNPLISLFIMIVKIDRMINTLYQMGAEDNADILHVSRNNLDANLRAIVSIMTSRHVRPNNFAIEEDFVQQFITNNKVVCLDHRRK